MMVEENDKSLAKAKAFFAKGQKLAQSSNFDYAIDMYIEGLHYAPDALEEGHLPLCELALKRNGAGGKKPTMVEKVRHMGGKTPQEQMLNAEYLFMKDPDHLPYAESMLKAAIAGYYVKTADWIANLIFQTNNALEKPSLSTYLLLKDSYTKIGKLDKALAACQHAVRLKPEDKYLADEFKNLSAELTMERGKYDGEGDFRKSIKDRESQEKLHSQADIIKTDDYRIKSVEDARKKIAKNPNLPANIFELADALSGLETEQGENEAISLLESTYKTTKDFSFQQKAGQIRIKQLKRKIRQSKTSLQSNPDNEQEKTVLDQLQAKFNSVELEHYRLCMENYPTSYVAKYDYAIRLVRNKKYDEAIPLFQEAQKDPKKKIASLNQTGLCFFMKGWFADAIDILNSTWESYELKDSAIGKELRYNLARAYEENGDTQKALDIFRKIAQSDFAYKDVSDRVNNLRNKKQEPNS
ncbi:MAG: tetratricopeptide repeat protein [Sedimentisphaerales bacterium]|nr:tetratricopeptide repeat protein [Sedimentisphaerales bacterium]